ncbi:MAG: CAAX prenyl protease-related protein [Gemmatimonadetes bacterium]|nr:CAAX prenyl protease-related protein [Gemmatimonadota bacterium]
MTDPAPFSPRHPAWPRAVPFAVFIVLMVAAPALRELLAPWGDPRWLYAVRSLAAAVAVALYWPAYREFFEAPAWKLSRLLAATGVGIAVFVVWILLDFPPLALGAGDGFDPRVDGRIHWGIALTRLAGSALVVPIIEELFWRSWIMRWLQSHRFLSLDPRRVGWKALALSSLVFAAEHHLWFAGLLAGLAYGELYRRTGDLRLAVLAHAVTNGVLGAWVLATGSWQFW